MFSLMHICYCCSTWSKRSRQSIDVLGRLYKRAAYIIHNFSTLMGTPPPPPPQVFNELQWPSLNELLDRVMACMVFKCTHGISTLSVQMVLTSWMMLPREIQEAITKNNLSLIVVTLTFIKIRLCQCRNSIME